MDFGIMIISMILFCLIPTGIAIIRGHKFTLQIGLLNILPFILIQAPMPVIFVPMVTWIAAIIWATWPGLGDGIKYNLFNLKDDPLVKNAPPIVPNITSEQWAKANKQKEDEVKAVIIKRVPYVPPEIPDLDEQDKRLAEQLSKKIDPNEP